MDGAVAVPKVELSNDTLLRATLFVALGADLTSLTAVGVGYLELVGPRSMLLGIGALGFGLGFLCAGVAVRLYGEPLALSAVVWVVAAGVTATGVAILTDTGPAVVEQAFVTVTGLVTGLVAVLFVGSCFHFLFQKINL